MNNNQIFQLPGCKIATLVREKKISASEVAILFIERIKKLNSKFLAWTHLDYDYFINQAKKIDISMNDGKLLGVPVGVKDIFNTEVYPTEMGSIIWKGHKAGNDARCITYLKNEGCIIAGKTDTAEFAVHTPGKSLNPWNSNHVTGTSSGGSAVAVSCAMVPISTSTQTSGSTIRPASYCGIYGMKPSFGVIPRTGVLKTTDTLDNIGFFGRSSKDLKLLFESMSVSGWNYPTLENSLRIKRNRKNKWKILFLKGLFWNDYDEDTKKSMEKIAQNISKIKNVSVVEIELPKIFNHSIKLHSRIYNSCLRYYFKDEIESDYNNLSDNFKELIEEAKLLSADDYKSALTEQNNLANELSRFMKKNDIDLILHNSSKGPAPVKIEPKINKDLNHLWTLCWVPVINIPFFKSKENLPFGYQLIGPRLNDYYLFDFLDLLIENNLAPDVSPLSIE